MNERQILTNDANSTREAYSAPHYKRFVFETSDLVQSSGDVGNIGNNVNAASTAKSSEIFAESDW